MDPALLSAMKDMTPEQAKQMMEQMTPEQKAQLQAMQEGMADMQHLVKTLQPSKDDPDAEVSLLKVLRALAWAAAIDGAPSAPAIVPAEALIRARRLRKTCSGVMSEEAILWSV